MFKILAILLLLLIFNTSVLALSSTNECFESSNDELNDLADHEYIRLIESVCVIINEDKIKAKTQYFHAYQIFNDVIEGLEDGFSLTAKIFIEQRVDPEHLSAPRIPLISLGIQSTTKLATKSEKIHYSQVRQLISF